MLFPLRSTVRPTSPRRATKARTRQRARFALFPEPLETRQLLANFVVTNTGDNGGVDPAPGAGTGTLRQAIVDSNNTPGSNSIGFSIGSGAVTIAPAAALPVINVPVSIDATTQPGFSGTPLVTLDGSSAGNFVSGLRISAGKSTVRGLAISRFTGSAAIELNTNGDNRIVGDYLGVDANGTTGVVNANFSDLLLVNGIAGNTIGGTTAADRNVLSGDSGVWILGAGATNNLVQGNYIGTDASGTAALGGFGVVVSTDGNTIARNVVSGVERSDGIQLGSNNNLVVGNYIGTDASGTDALGNSLYGVGIGGNGNTVGGTTAADRNIISGNGQGGININGPATSGNLIEGNYIGTDASGTVALPNTFDGISLTAQNNTVGGTAAGAGNVISGNGADGINLTEFPGKPVTGNVILGNFIGTDATGTQALGNVSSGIFFDNPFNTNNGGNTVGGTTFEARNVISANGSSGISLLGSGGGQVIEGNVIGTDLTGALPLGNRFNGVGVASPNNLIGGTSPGAGNIIAFNRTGVLVSSVPDLAGINNAILGNSIFANDALGIDLIADGTRPVFGPTPNDYQDFDTGGNNLQNAPVLLAAVPDGNGGTNVTGTLNSTPNTTFRVELFADDAVDPSGFGQGQVYLGSVDVTTDDNGDAAIAADLPGAVALSQFVSATATDPDGNTSEFGETIQPTATAPADLAVTLDSLDYGIDIGGDITYSLTMTNRGPEAATNAVLSDTLPAGVTVVSMDSPDGTPTEAGGVVTLAVDTLPVGGSVSMTIVVHPADIGTYVNTATASADQPNALPVQSSASFTTDVFALSNLAVQIQAGPSPVAPGGALTYTVTLTNQGPSPATDVYFDTYIPFDTTFVTASISEGDYQFYSDYGDVSAYFTDLAAGASVTMTVTVTAPDTTGTITVEAAAFGNEDDADYSDNDVTLDTDVAVLPGQFVFDAASSSANEGDGTVTITVNRVGGSSGAATVDYAVAGGTAADGVDDSGASGTLSFDDGQTSASFTVTIVDDTVSEPDETLDLVLSNPTGGTTLGDATTTELTIHDNDLAGSVQFAAASFSVQPGDGVATITVTRTGGAASGVAVGYATVDGTATAGADYTATAGTLVFGAGQSSLTFQVPILMNLGAAPATRALSLVLSIPAQQGEPDNPGLPPTAGTPSQATLTINIPDGDADGVTSAVEDGAPNGGDGNLDGIPDSQQANVTSLPNATDGRYVTLVSPAGTTLVNVQALPAPTDAPSGVTFPVGRFRFVVDGVAPGQPVTVSLILPSGVTVNGYEKYGPTPDQPAPHWYAFGNDGATGATVTSKSVTLVFIDGQRGDSDLAVNGRVTDPGGPALVPAAGQLTTHGMTLVATAGQPYSGMLGSFTDSNPLALASSFRAYINWGDGTVTAGTVRGGNGSFAVSGTHTFTAPATYSVLVKITPVNGRQTFTLSSVFHVTRAGNVPSGSLVVIEPKKKK